MKSHNKTKEIFYLIMSSLGVTLCITLIVMLAIAMSRLSEINRYVTSHECAAEADTEIIQSEQVNSTPERMYVLGVKDGKLTVYAADGYNVIEILDTYVYSLPLSDREAVASGINVYSVNELISLIEDYTS